MSFSSIHTLEARGNILLDLVKGHFRLEDIAMRRFIWQTVGELVQILLPKGVNYSDLRPALVPQVTKNEVGLFFDTAVIASAWYGWEVHSRILPLLPAKGSHSSRHGDLIGENAHQGWIRTALDVHLRPSGNSFDMRTSSQIYCVYLNNVSNSLREQLHDGLRTYRPYIGYADLTYASQFKAYLSRVLAAGFLKHKRTVVQGHPDDVPPNVDENTLGYPFQEIGLTCRSVPDSYFGLLLSYKIECPVIPGDASDTLFSVNAISDAPEDPASYAVDIDEAKFGYLKDAKTGTLRRLGVLGSPKATLEQLVQGKLSSNYIYNMAFSDQFNVGKFNMVLELEPLDGGEPVRTLAAFALVGPERRVRLITLF